MNEGERMKRGHLFGFEKYFSAAMLACGITWFWDFIASLYFPGQIALNLTLVSAVVYLEAAFLAAFGFTRRMARDQIPMGLRVGVAAWITNTLFRLLIFDLSEALLGVVVYLVSFLIGGVGGGLFAGVLHRNKDDLGVSRAD